MSKRIIRAIMFDYGGVLAEEGFKNTLNDLALEQNLAIKNMPYEGMLAVYDSGFVLGKGSETEFWSLLRKRTGLQGSDNALRERVLRGFTIRPWMLDLVRALHNQGYITGILSDQTHWLDLLDDEYHFYQYFDYVYNSFYTGKGKLNLSLFDDVVKELGIPASSIVFIDDDIGNVERAAQQGWQAIQYQHREQLLNELNLILLEGDSHGRNLC